MIGGSQVASWEVYPRKHADPDAKKQMAGAGSTTGERASFNYGHEMNYTSQMTDDMKLACGHAASRDLVGEACSAAPPKLGQIGTHTPLGR